MGGGIEFGYIDAATAEATGLAQLPVRVAHGEHRGTNNGYGIRHILASHGEELAKLDYGSVQDFIDETLSNYDAVYRSSTGRWMLVWKGEGQVRFHRILVIELHKVADCYCIITGWTREGYRRLKEDLIWQRP